MFTIAFYIHHHGSGHLMRCLQIAGSLKGYPIILMGSALESVDTNIYPNIELLHLPLDLPAGTEDDDLSFSNTDAFHYAPLGISGIRDRTAIMTDLFKRQYPLLLIVDVSVEVTLLARLCSIPTIVIRQHGIRTDLPHQLAYQSAELLLAPYSPDLYIGDQDLAYEKTVFSGGFSRLQVPETAEKEIQGRIGILIGGGGSSIDKNFIIQMATACPSFTFEVFGLVTNAYPLQNIHWHGRIADPLALLQSCALIIGNTGHNTVMEVAALNKRFIGIPEERPFSEQIQKAEAIANRSGVVIIQVADLGKQQWNVMIEKLLAEKADWHGVIEPDALPRIAEAIIEKGNRLFTASNNRL